MRTKKCKGANSCGEVMEVNRTNFIPLQEEGAYRSLCRKCHNNAQKQRARKMRSRRGGSERAHSEEEYWRTARSSTPLLSQTMADFDRIIGEQNEMRQMRT